jgi:hypothetical protein
VTRQVKGLSLFRCGGCVQLASQTFGSCADDGLGSAGYLQFCEDVGDVIADGVCCQAKTRRDRWVRHSAGDEFEYLAFARREFGKGALVLDPWA